MDKARRQELTRLRHRKRCKRLGIVQERHYCYKAQTTPCSCNICRSNKYDRNLKHKNGEERHRTRFNRGNSKS